MPTESVARLPKPALPAAPRVSQLRLQADGVAVEFTTPALASARVRFSDADKLDVVIADLGGGSGNYVVPLTSAGRRRARTCAPPSTGWPGR